MKLLKNPYFLLFLICCVALILRVINLKDNVLVAYDQARDAQRVMEIMQKKLKIVGPETDIPGVFNGPLLYYMLTPVYALTNFNMNYAALFFVLINLSGVVLIYFSSQVLFNNKKISLFAALLWAVSYEQINFSRYISNASPMSASTIVFFLGLSIALFKKKEIGLIISVVGLAAAIHFNFYLVYLLIFYPIFFITFKYRPSLKTCLTAIGLLILLLSTFLIAEMKWRFMMTRSLLGYFGHQSTNYASHLHFFTSLADNGMRYYNRISEAIGYSLFSYGKFAGFVLLFLFLGIVWKNKKNVDEKNKLLFLYIWLFSTLPLFLFKSGVLNVQVINSSIFAPLTIVFAAGIYYLFKYQGGKIVGILVVALILFSNLFQLANENFQNAKLLALQPLILKSEKKMIDYSYIASEKKPFSICAVTNPLFVNTLWSFLYTTYGKSRYGYVPTWSGQQQILNKSYLPYDSERTSVRYLIIEPSGGIPDSAREATIYLEDKVSQLVEEKTFGDITIQKRVIPTDKALLRDTQNLSQKQRLHAEFVNSVEARYHCSIEY